MSECCRRPVHLLVMAKEPRPGQVKTRLCPPLSPIEAAEVAAAALADTLLAVDRCAADHKTVALAGRPGPWLPPGMATIPQRGNGLDRRLAHAWADTAQHCDGWGLQIGMDTPQVTSAELDRLIDLLTAPAACPTAIVGPAPDGGWWIVGLPGTNPHHVFYGLPMSTAETCAATRQRLHDLGHRVIAAPSHRDIDTVADLAAVADLIPASHTATVARPILRLHPATPTAAA